MHVLQRAYDCLSFLSGMALLFVVVNRYVKCSNCMRICNMSFWHSQPKCNVSFYLSSYYPRRARSASAWILFSLWMYVCLYVCTVCLYVCMYVSALERKRLIGMS